MRVAIRLMRRAQADRLAAFAAGAGERRAPKASVTQPPQDGRANQMLLRLLASAWRFPRRSQTIFSGADRRQKRVQITGGPQRLPKYLRGLVAALPEV